MPEKAKTRLRDRPVRLAVLIAGTLFTALLGLFVGAVVERYGLFDFLGNRPSIAEQLDRIRHTEATDGRHVVVSERIDLHGAGRLSFFMVFRDDNLTSSIRGSNPRSDLIRIYDRGEHEKLHLAYEFEPRVDPCPECAVYVFIPRDFGDVDGDGKQDVLGAWMLYAMQPILPAPMLIEWSDERSRYITLALLKSPKHPYPGRGNVSNLLLAPHGGYAMNTRHWYVDPLILTDKRTGLRIGLQSAEEYMVTKSRNFTRLLLAAYVVRQRSHADIATLQLIPWSFDLAGSRVEIFSCLPAPRAGSFVPLFRGSFPLLTTMSAYWRRLERHSQAQIFC